MVIFVVTFFENASFTSAVTSSLASCSSTSSSVGRRQGCLGVNITQQSSNGIDDVSNVPIFLESVTISSLSSPTHGLKTGIDTAEFTPKKPDIVKTFGLSDLRQGKAENKTALQKELGLPVNENTPLIVMVTRLTEGKGIDLVLHIFEELLQEDLQFVILGTGDKKYEKILSDIACRYPEKARTLVKFDRALSKRMYASADIFLMPSKSEPCGLAQMIACSYATVPVVRGVGGLYDTIVPYGEKNANGFVFYNFNAHEMLFRIKDALALYRDKATWDILRKNAMKTDFTWKKSAKQYIEIYAELCEQ